MTGPTPQAELFTRLGDLVGLRDLEPELEARILAAYDAAGPEATWETLPEETRRLFEEAEAIPTTDYDDPADDPEQQIDVDEDNPHET